MKKNLLFITTLLWCSLDLTAQVVINSNITANTIWTNDNIYLLQGGCLYVTNNATLTIQPGTIIKGDQAALIISRGAKIIAGGTPEMPIVFTSSKPAGQRTQGDWGGLLLLGKAPINVPGGESVVEGGCDQALYGGADPNDNSGILRYVRIEFAGIPFTPNNELNSLTLGGVGNGTIIEHVQNSYGGDDATEWFGGTVNGKYFVNYRTVDDIFDTDFGYSGKNQFLLGISDPNIADVSGSNGFESDNDANGSANEPKTDAHFSNVTLLGPLAFSSTVNSNFKRAAHIRRCSYLDIFNSALTGFPVGLLLDGDCTNDGFTTSGDVEFGANTLANAMGKNVTTTVAASLPTIFNVFNSSGDDSLASASALMMANPFDFSTGNPDFRLMPGSPLLSGANFTSPTLQDAFFTPTTYRGAFGDTDWTDCWAEWDPVNADYANSINYAPVVDFTTTVNGHEVTFTNASAGGASYHWDFGDGSTSSDENPVHTFAGSAGPTPVTLTVTTARGCIASTTQTVGLTATHEVEGLSSLKVFPNPFQIKTLVEFSLKNQMELNVQLLDVNGKLIKNIRQEFNSGFNQFEVDGSGLNAGVYFLRLLSGEGQKTVRISVIK